jgi:hypothetical protein
VDRTDQRGAQSRSPVPRADSERWDFWDAIEAWRAQAEAPGTGITFHEVGVAAYDIASTRSPF